MTQVHDGEALQNAAKLSKLGIHGLADQMGIPRSTLYYNFRKLRLDDNFKDKAAETLGLATEQVFGGVYNDPAAGALAHARMTGDELRMRRAFGDSSTDREGLSVVPIMAQAGYSKHYLDPKFVDELEQMRVPNMPFKGDRYRVFEVSGDSMEPTLKEHFHVVGESVDPAFWSSTAQFYIHVVVTQDRIMVKRLFRKDDNSFVCISDNEEFYPQFILKKSEIKELWLVKRKIDWEMPPPKRFEIMV
jgi:phage repressor protein C with HTH and peptisase S24 domain